MRGHPQIRGHLLKTVSYLPDVKEPVMKGHMSCRDICHVGTSVIKGHLSSRDIGHQGTSVM